MSGLLDIISRRELPISPAKATRLFALCDKDRSGHIDAEESRLLIGMLEELLLEDGQAPTMAPAAAPAVAALEPLPVKRPKPNQVSPMDEGDLKVEDSPRLSGVTP